MVLNVGGKPQGATYLHGPCPLKGGQTAKAKGCVSRYPGISHGYLIDHRATWVLLLANTDVQ